MKRKIFSLLLAASLALGTGLTGYVPVLAEETGGEGGQALHEAMSGSQYGFDWTYDGNGALQIVKTGTSTDLNLDVFHETIPIAGEVTALVIGEGFTEISIAGADDFSNLQEVTIPVSMQKICQDAFCNSTKLQTVHYAGTEAQWNQIYIAYGNHALRDAAPYVVNTGGSWEDKDITWTLNGTLLTISGSGSIEYDARYRMSIGDTNAVPWSEYWDYIENIIVGPEITGVSALLSSSWISRCRVKEILFEGDKPEAFMEITPACTTYYCEGKAGWTEEFRDSLEQVTWSAYCRLGDNGEIITEHEYQPYGAITIPTDGNEYKTPENEGWRYQRCKDCTFVSIEMLPCLHGIDVTEIHSEHPYSSSDETDWSLGMEGADEIVLTFDAQTKLETNYDDFIYVYDENDNVFGKYVNTELAGRTLTVPGSRVRIKLFTDHNTDEWGFAVTKAYGQNHDWQNRIVLEPVTTTRDGLEQYTCSICQEVKTEKIKAKYKIYEEWNGIEWGLTYDGELDIFHGTNTGIPSCEWVGVEGDHYTSAPWGAYRDEIKKITVMDGIHFIGSYAFLGMKQVKEVIVYQGVHGIDYYAFMDCTALERITLPDTITTIESRAFEDCRKLQAFRVPEGLVSLGEGVFNNCASLKRVDVSSLYKWFEIEFCYGANGYSNPLMEGAMLYINGDLKEEIVIPDDITEIPDYVFAGASYINFLFLHENVTSIGEYAFYGCSNLQLGRDKLPNQLKTIGDEAFYGCKSITAIEFPSTIENIGYSAFSGCTSLASVIFAEDSKVSTLRNTFSYCSLKEVTLPASIRIEYCAFDANPDLTRIVFHGDFPVNIVTMTSSMDGSKLDLYYYACKETWASEDAVAWLSRCSYLYEYHPVHMSKFRSDDVPAACTQEGSTTFTCDHCKEVFTETLTPLGHDYQLTETVDADCIHDGHLLYTCSRCDQARTETIPADIVGGHRYGEEQVKEPTCQDYGYHYRVCEICGNTTHSDYVSPTEHHYQAEVIPATCTSGGYTNYVCRDCGTSKTDNWTDQLEHDYQVTVKEPTCLDRGYTVYSCKNCMMYYRSTYTPARGHSYKETVTAPTCLSEGYSTFTCERCEHAYTGKWTEPKGHSFTEAVTASTCTEGGFTTYTCADCGYSYVGEETLKTGHRWDQGSISEKASYLSAGIRTYHCQKCDAHYEEEIPRLEKTALSDCEIMLGYTSCVYSGIEKRPSVIVKNGACRVSADDFTVTYAENVNAGIARVVITAKDGESSVSGTTIRNFTIRKAPQEIAVSMTEETVHVTKTAVLSAAGIGAVSFEALDPLVASISEDGVLTGLKAGTARIKVTFSGNENYEAAEELFLAAVDENHICNTSFEHMEEDAGGDITYDEVLTCRLCDREVTRTYKTIHNLKAAATAMTLAADTYTYTGSSITPEITVSYAGETLVQDVDYVLTYGANVNAGEGTITVEGIGDYTGVVTETFAIGKAESTISLKAKTASYTGKTISAAKPVVTGSDGTVTTTYYSDAACTKKLSGGPKAVGTYYAKATVAEDENHFGAASEAAKLVIKDNSEISYRTYVQTYGWQQYVTNGATSGTVGEGKRLEGVNIKLTKLPVTGGITYRCYCQTYGWLSWSKDGVFNGTRGEGKRLEAINIKLTGDMAGAYDIYYRVQAQKFGWLGWAKNGEKAGTQGYGYRLEAIQIKLVPKGSTAPNSSKAACMTKS